jgi:hypothetical protein
LRGLAALRDPAHHGTAVDTEQSQGSAAGSNVASPLVKFLADASNQPLLARLWFAAAVVLFGLIIWQQYPALLAYPTVGIRASMRMDLSIMFKPWNLLPWAVLDIAGIIWPWKMRKVWRQYPELSSIFLMCCVAVVCFIVDLLIYR